jgi:hypothetical protein
MVDGGWWFGDGWLVVARFGAHNVDMRRSFLLLAALMVVAAPVQGQRQAVDVSRLGPQVGARVPDFTLVDQTGTVRTLQSIMGPRGAMLVFIRSADW